MMSEESSPASVMCYDPDSGKFQSLIHLDIIGETGRFEGATGTAMQIYEVWLLDGQNSNVGHVEGYLIRSWEHDWRWYEDDSDDGLQGSMPDFYNTR